MGYGRSKPRNGLVRGVLHDVGLLEMDALINISTSTDPYVVEEVRHGLTRAVLEILIPRGFRVLITTKASITMLRDLDLYRKGRIAIMITITTLDDGLARIIEPNAPPPSLRLWVLRQLARAGIPVGVRVDPIIPFVNDDRRMLEELVGRAYEAGALHVVTSTYKARPDSLSRLKRAFPELGLKLDRLYKEAGSWIHGYWYLPRDMRERLLRPVIDEARRLGLTYATCREGLGPGFKNAPSCDGSHLIELGVRLKRG